MNESSWWDLAVFGMTALAVCAGCLVPNRCLPSLPNDKLLHFAAYSLLSLLALRIAHDQREALLWLAGLCIAGWLIECLQSLVPGRRFCWRDIGANVAGIFSAALAVYVYKFFSDVFI